MYIMRACLRRYVCHEFNSVTVLMLKVHGSVSICGKVLVRCVAGNCMVHGFAMNADVGWQKIFSPSTQSLLVIKAVDGEEFTRRSFARHVADETSCLHYLLPQKRGENQGSKKCGFLKKSPTQCAFLGFLGFIGFFGQAGKK